MGPRRTRVAVVQIAYHPAILVDRRSPLEDPLFKPGAPDSLLAPGKELPEVFAPRLAALRRRIRETYDAQLLARVQAILTACRAWKVEVVVFPEYSIPWEILGGVADAAGEMVVVAGTHTVERDTKKKDGIYQRLGLPPEAMPALGQAVAPVLHGGRLLGLSAKLNASQHERQMKAGTAWAPIEMPGGVPGPMGVLVCLDFLYRESEAHRTLVAEAMERCRFLVVPSLTPAYSLPEFAGKGWEEARRYGRPVLYCDGAEGGGTTVYVDEGRPADLKSFPEHAGLLDAGDEGVIVADVDLGYERPGRSTRYAGTHPVVPVAAATLVYRANPTGEAYARWLEEAGELLGREDDEAVEALAERVAAGREVLLNAGALAGGAARGRRLGRLVREIERVTSVEEIRQLTREVVVPAGVLPLGVLRSGMARGAAEEIQRWVGEQGAGGFGAVVDALRETAERIERKEGPWSEGAGRAIEGVSAKVRGGGKPADPKALLVYIDRLEADQERGFDAEDEKASKCFMSGQYAEAREWYRKILGRAGPVVEGPEAIERPRLRRWIERCKLNVALATLNLQERDEALALLLDVNPAELPMHGRLMLAETLALLGEREKAEALLPQESEVADEDRPRLREAHQHFELLDGRIPEDLADSADLHMRAAAVLLAQGDLSGAAQRAWMAVQLSDSHAFILASAIQVTVEALRRAVNEVPPVTTTIQVEHRGLFADVLEKYFAETSAREGLSDRVREHMRKTEAMFRDLAMDGDKIDVKTAAIVEREDIDDARRAALRLALEGRADEAIRALAPDSGNHPWLGRFDRVQMLALAKQLDRALVEALVLAGEFPNRAPIEFLIAQLYARLLRSADGVAHADIAYKQFPAKGYRLLLAGLRLDNGQTEDAWELVKDLEDDQPRALRLRMVAAELTGKLDKAEQAWRRYVELRPEDAAARVGQAQLLFRMDRREEAAAVAWKTYEDHSNRLDATELYVCGWAQRMTDSLAPEELRRRIRDIAARMKARFPGSLDAEERRRHLLKMLGDETSKEAASLDLDLLVQHGRAQMGSDTAPLTDFLQQRRAQIAAVVHLAGVGAAPVTTVAKVTDTPISLLVTRLMERSREARGLLCPPVSLTDVRPAFDLRGAMLLVSDLELVLLEALALADPLGEALGPEGRLVLLPSAQNRIHADFSASQIEADRDALPRTEALLRQLARLPDSPADESTAVVSDEPIARANHLSSRAFLEHLRTLGTLDAAQYAILEEGLPGESGSPVSLHPLPTRIAIRWYLVERLFRCDALRPAFDAFQGRLYLDAEVKPHFQLKRDDLMVKLQAVALAAKVHARLQDRWIHQELRAPITPDLPPLRDPSELNQKLILEPLQEMMAHRQAMFEHPSWWRLSAEFFGSASFGAPELTAQLRWESHEAYRTMAMRMSEAAARDLTLPTLIRMLALDPKFAESRLIKLAELGFADALGAVEILGLARRYRDLDGTEPRRVLDAQEWMAHAPRHHGGDMARRRLAYAYAAAVFNAFLAKDLSDAQRKSLLGTLLHRQEILADESAGNTLDQTFVTLAFATADEWQRAWKPHESGGGVLDLEGSIASLWRALSAWSGLEGPRRAARGRALREVWRLLSRRPGGPSTAVIATLGVAQWTNVADDREGNLTSAAPELDALMILSALWREDPFKDGPFAPILASGIESLAKFDLFGGRYPDLVGDDGEPVFDAAPMEALLLRAGPEARRDAAGRLKAQQGPYDGICYELLKKIEKSPDEQSLLEKYARHASTAFFRLVQDEPPFLRIWGQAQRAGDPDERPRFVELLDILSEERPLGDEPLTAILVERMEKGCWSEREDRSTLLFLATEIPGMLPGYTISEWLEPEIYEEYVRSSLDEMDRPDELPIAQVVRAVLFLRVAATLRPLVKLPEGEVDLREMLPARLERLLNKVTEPPMPDTLGAAEGALLRVCGEVIQRLSYPAILPYREGLWLTWRLFQWLCLQLDAISPDARRDGIRRLVAQAPELQAPRDVLDPFGFGRDRFDHRLAAVLHALGTMGELVKLFKQHNPTAEAPEPRSASSPALEDKLLTLARGVHLGTNLGSVLDWNAPGNVPDLALNALLRLSRSRFAELGPEARSRRFSALPEEPGALQKSDPAAFAFAHQIIHAAAEIAASLTGDERALLEAKLRAMADSPPSRVWRLVIFVSLFAAGVDHLEGEVRSLTVEHITEKPAALMFGRLLLGVAARDPARIEQTLDVILAAAAPHSTEPPRLDVGLAVGALGRLLVHGAPEAQKVARALLLRLAERPPFRDDPRMDEVIGFFGLREARA